MIFYSICLVDRNPLVKKDYICEWVKKYLETNDGDISWKLLQSEMETKFGKFRSRNDLKNIWNVNKRRHEWIIPSVKYTINYLLN